MTKGRAHAAVTVIGKDRPGIVAGTAQVLYRLGCNIEDSSSTMLGGQFATILIVSHDGNLGHEQLAEEFRTFGAPLGLSTFVRSLNEDESRYAAPQGEICVVSVYGSDRPGIVYRVTQELADHGINITDLNTKLVGTEEAPVYVMILEAALPENIEVETVEQMLENLKKELQVDISVRSVTPVTL
ncbi:MAG TPA: ACT domain-containing protein [Verrucomicrobiae bacterium]|nr:ACT domain-containing protein [Verrucomicrobiae bacterium]